MRSTRRAVGLPGIELVPEGRRARKGPLERLGDVQPRRPGQLHGRHEVASHQGEDAGVCERATWRQGVHVHRTVPAER